MSSDETNNTKRSLRSILDVVSTVVMCVAAVSMVGFVIWDRTHPRTFPASGGRAPALLPTLPISLDGVPVKGAITASVVLIEFSDFECPYCGRFARETWPELEKQYVQAGKIRVAFLNAPGRNHAQAERAAEAAECAGRQGKFWEMREAVFARQELADDRLRATAASIGVDMSAFERCLAGGAIDKLRADAAVARQVSIGGTPTFFVGVLRSDGQVRVVERLSGAKPIAEFQKVLDKVVATQVAGM